MEIELLNRIKVSQKNLLEVFPPFYVDERKNFFYLQALKKYGNENCKLHISRWRCADKNQSIDEQDFSKTSVDSVENYFHYDEDVSTESRKVWFLNFADYLLFGYYDSSMFAQDEIQTLEHPLLGAVTEMLDSGKLPNLEPKTAVKYNFCPQPYLIQNVPWWIKVNTSSDRSGINVYGRNFFELPIEDVQKKVGVVDGKYFNNIIAVAAPTASAFTEYSVKEIQYILQALFSSFGGAKKLSGEKKCVIHTGNWGCGAFGGNRELMYIAQLYVAHVLGIDEIVFHAVSPDLFKIAQKKIESMKNLGSIDEVVDYLEAMHYRWGESDGN